MEEIHKKENEVKRYREELAVVQEDRQAIITKLMSKDLELDELRLCYFEILFDVHRDKFALAESNTDKAKATSEMFQSERDRVSAVLKEHVDHISKLSAELEEKKAAVKLLEEQLNSTTSSRDELKVVLSLLKFDEIESTQASCKKSI